jgi:acyl-CoA reductase-like NAD-dependent aldehyde dehydrogenase
MFGSMRLVAQGGQSMPVEMLTYAVLGARLKISPEAARSLVKRLRLQRSLSHDGKALVNVDLAEIKHTRRPPGARAAGTTRLEAEIETLQAEIAELEARAAGHRADFERERERADRLIVELLQTAAETRRPRKRRHGLKASWRPFGLVAGQSAAMNKPHAD